MLSSVKAGDRIERVYYAVPGSYNIGDVFDSFIPAVRAALAKRDKIVKDIIVSYPAGWPEVERIAAEAAKVQCVVDLRWEICKVDGCRSDFMVERTNVNHLTIEHCDRMDAMEVGV
jgi:hypothetical protein